MGYRFSETNRRISTAGASNITRIASRSVTEHEIPIHVHQHYALEFHFVLNPIIKNNGSVETCMRRRFLLPWFTREFCLLLENSALSGLCSCIFDVTSVLSDNVEQCFRAQPIENNSFDCDLCVPRTIEEFEDARWRAKYVQMKEKQTFVVVDRLMIIVRR